jgi:hypothetical protein
MNCFDGGFYKIKRLNDPVHVASTARVTVPNRGSIVENCGINCKIRRSRARYASNSMLSVVFPGRNGMGSLEFPRVLPLRGWERVKEEVRLTGHRRCLALLLAWK